MTLFPTQVHDLADHRLRGLGVLGVSGRGTVDHPSQPLLAIPARPLVSGAPADVEELSSPGRAPAIINDQARQPEPVSRGQSSVSVGHEGLLGGGRFLDAPLHIGRPSPNYGLAVPDRTTSLGITLSCAV